MEAVWIQNRDRQHINPSTTKNYIRHLGMISGSTHWSVVFSDACFCVILWQIHQLFTVPHLNSWFFPQGIDILASGQEWLKNKELRLEVVFTLCGLPTNLWRCEYLWACVCKCVIEVSRSGREMGDVNSNLVLLNSSLISQGRWIKTYHWQNIFFLEHSDILGMRL